MCFCLCIPIQYHIYERNTDLFPSPMDGKPATDSALRPDILAKGRRWQTTQGLFHLAVERRPFHSGPPDH